eukprot:5004947-Amphidinium_carterae.1
MVANVVEMVQWSRMWGHPITNLTLECCGAQIGFGKSRSSGGSSPSHAHVARSGATSHTFAPSVSIQGKSHSVMRLSGLSGRRPPHAMVARTWMAASPSQLDLDCRSENLLLAETHDRSCLVASNAESFMK